MKKKINLADNLFLKVLSVVIAMILWLAVLNINDAEKTKTFNLTVNLVNTEIITNNGKVFRVEDDTDNVKVKVKARQSILDELSGSDFILTADMGKDLKYDKYVGITVECKNKNIVVDEDVTLNRSNIEVSIEDSATEQFQVFVTKVGEENEGLVVGSMVPEQTIIKISGPVSIVEKINRVEAVVDVTGLPGSTVKTCALNLYDSAGEAIDTTYLNFVGKMNGIDVTVSMLNKKTVPLKFSYTGTPAENYNITDISCKPDAIEIAGSASVLSGITRLEISPEAVNVEGIDDELQLVVDLEQYLPSGVIIPDETENSVLVIVEVEYVEPEEDETDEDEDTSKPSEDKTETTKPSESGDNKNDTTVDKDNTTNDNNSSTDTEDSGSGNTTSKDETSTGTDNKDNQNNEAGSENNDKTESTS